MCVYVCNVQMYSVFSLQFARFLRVLCFLTRDPILCVYTGVPKYIYTRSSCGSVYVFTISILYLGYTPTCAFACVLHLNRIVWACVRLGDGTGYQIKMPVYRIHGVCVQVYYRFLYIYIYVHIDIKPCHVVTRRQVAETCLLSETRYAMYYKNIYRHGGMERAQPLL